MGNSKTKFFYPCSSMNKILAFATLVTIGLAQITVSPKFKQLGQAFKIRFPNLPAPGKPLTTINFSANDYVIHLNQQEFLRDETNNEGKCCSANVERYANEVRYKIQANEATSRLIDYALAENFDNDVFLTHNEGRSWSIVVKLEAVKSNRILAPFDCVIERCSIYLKRTRESPQIVALTYHGENVLDDVAKSLPQQFF
eukprot:TRINITY_DN3132_c0_g2_i1.p1 TRINITY_DN3132_c0_g2~~TRINITY_DN3132_c0_g2_i1.p1  ORF type:complete len:199 (-),score=47.59 TRINITY_DN3132_c0_g2_i1:193-789(-)